MNYFREDVYIFKMFSTVSVSTFSNESTNSPWLSQLHINIFIILKYFILILSLIYKSV